MNSRRFFAVAVLALSPLVAACGSDSSGSSGAAVTTAPAVAGIVKLATPADGQKLIARLGKDLTIIDVRTPSEYAAGHLANAVNIDLEGGQFTHGIASLPKGAAYMVYCHSGRRSAIAASTMHAAGFTTIYDLGGIASWQAAGLPTVTG